ncbi:uncharacterized protein [Antedon mediterranea]|uniref:uncharacterized protein n=1 Tax=Antedon mediterranea TaxID=105859 RepID=UPI003AF9B46B
MIGALLPVFAGLCAALGSVCAKLALNSDVLMEICTRGREAGSTALMYVIGAWFYFHQGQGDKISTALEDETICQTISFYLQALSFFGIFLFNALMWTLFVKSLQLSRSSVQATVTNSASNFFFSAFIGHLLFGEPLGIKWWIGSMLIITGLILMQNGSGKVSNEEENIEELQKKDK